jgi:hypothetical protein
MMDDLVQHLRAAAAVLLDCHEHAPTKDGRALVNLHKRADEMNAAADEIERLRKAAVTNIDFQEWLVSGKIDGESQEDFAKRKGAELGRTLLPDPPTK